MMTKKFTVSIVLLFALSLSFVGGIVPAYALEPEAPVSYTQDEFTFDVIAADDEPDIETHAVEEPVDVVFDLHSTPSTIEQFVTRLYNLVQGRAPEEPSFSVWVSDLRAGRQTGAGIAYGFFFSREFIGRNTTNAEFVEILYLTMLDRSGVGDPGSALWEQRLYEGYTREYVFGGFVNGIEFGRLCAGAGITTGSYTVPPGSPMRAFVTRLYRTTLGREPELLGLNGWTDALLTGSTGGHVAHGFIFSREMAIRNLNNADFVEVLYVSLLGRSSDVAGKTEWVRRLNQGLPREDVFAGFVNSVEFGRLCTDAGIIRGTYVPPAGGMIQLFVKRLFIETQRPYSNVDLDFWFDALRNGRETAAAFANGQIFRSPPLYHIYNTDEYIVFLYDTLLDRVPTANERTNMRNLMNNGVSRYTIFSMLVNSTEFDDICRSYGMVRGTAPAATNSLPDDGSNQVKIWNLIRDAGVNGISNSPEHIAGIIGNMLVEVGYYSDGYFHYSALCPFQREVGAAGTPDADLGVGLLQWRGARRTAMENFMWSNGVSRVQFRTEMDKHLDSYICTHDHNQALTDRVLSLQVQFMLNELNSTERQYIEFINSPSNRSGIAGARAYAELFCVLVQRPGAGIGPNNNIIDPGVRDALRASTFVGGPDVLDRVSYSRLNDRRDNAQWVFNQFLWSHN